MRHRKTDLSERIGEMWVVPDDVVPGDSGWSVFVSAKALQQREAQEMKQLEDGCSS